MEIGTNALAADITLQIANAMKAPGKFRTADLDRVFDAIAISFLNCLAMLDEAEQAAAVGRFNEYVASNIDLVSRLFVEHQRKRKRN